MNKNKWNVQHFKDLREREREREREKYVNCMIEIGLENINFDVFSHYL